MIDAIFKKRFFILGGLIPSLVSSMLAAQPARAQTSSSPVNSLISEIRAQGGDVQIGASEPGSAPGGARLNNVTLAFPANKDGNGLRIAFGRLDLSGVHSDESKIVIDQARGDHAEILTTGGKLSLGKFSLDHLSIPRLATAGKAGERPFQSLLGAFSQISQTELKELSINDFKWERAFNSPSQITVDHMLASDFAAGRIARIAVSQLTSTSDGSDRVSTAETLLLENLNPALIVEIAKSQANPGEPRNWKPLAGAITIRGLAQTEKSARTAIEQVQFNGLRLRHFSNDPSKFFDLAATSPAYFTEHPDEARKFTEALMDVVKLDRATVTKLSGTDGQDATPRRFGIAAIEIDDLDPLSANSIVISDIQDYRGDNGVQIGRVTLSKLELVSVGVQPANGAVPGKAPVFGGIAVEAAKLAQPGGAVELQSFNWTATDRVGMFPTKLTATIAGLTLPSSIVPDPGLRDSLTKAGVTTLPVEVDLAANWDGVREQVDLDHMNLSIGNIGRIELKGTLTGMPKAALESAESLQTAALGGGLKGLRIKYTDAGLLNHLINVFATTNKQSPEQIRKALTANMPVILGSIPDATARNGLIFALISFLNDPQSLEFSSLALTPVPVPALLTAYREAPSAIPGLLKLNSTATHKR